MFKNEPVLAYAEKCWWLLSRGGAIKDVISYNIAGIARILEQTKKYPNILPSMSYMQSYDETGDSYIRCFNSKPVVRTYDLGL